MKGYIGTKLEKSNVLQYEGVQALNVKGLPDPVRVSKPIGPGQAAEAAPTPREAVFFLLPLPVFPHPVDAARVTA